MLGEDSIRRRRVLKVVGGAGIGMGLAGAASGSTIDGTERTASRGTSAGPPGGTEECGVDSVFQEELRSIEEGGEQVHMLERQVYYPCPVSVQFDVGPLDLEAYLTLDGRTPTQEDYDRHTDQPMESGGFTVHGDRLEPGDELGLLVVGVDVPEDSGEYLTILSESTNELVAPVAAMEQLTDNPTEGDSVEFSGSESFARLGSLQSYEWSYKRTTGGDSGSGTGEEFSFQPGNDGQYRVTLDVTDGFGRTDSAEQYINVEGGGGFCFITTATANEGETLDSLRQFRDDSMATTPVGRGLVGLYYRISPPVARAMARHPEGRTARLGRWYVRQCAALSERKRDLDSRVASVALGVLITGIYVAGVIIAVAMAAGIRISELLR
jgi:hypothetical protein